MKFANIHNHTDLGSFDSILRPSRMAERLVELNQNVLVQSEHGTLRGMVQVANEAHKNNLKYIPACEMYVTFQKPQRSKDEFGRLYYHLLLIAKNNTGLVNLQRLIALSYKADRYYYKPRVSIDDVFEHSEGLIATSGCLASLTSQSILAEANTVQELTCGACYSLGCPCDDHKCDIPGDLASDPALRGARSLDSLVEQFSKYFKDDYYLEIQDSGAGDDQLLVNKVLTETGKRLGIPLVATSDAHYARPEDARLRTLMLKIRHGKSSEDTTESFYDEGKIHLKSGGELAEIFGEEPIKNTVDLVNKCNVILPGGSPLFPVPNIDPCYLEQSGVPDDQMSKEYLRSISEVALADMKLDNDEYKHRLQTELDVICELGFADYFLVLKEILDWCRDQGILVGPARGSSAGSLVAYVLEITQIDPIKYGLFFSRFLNKSRVSLPDSIESSYLETDRVKFSERKLQCGV